jgi:hypothetical protein
MTKAEEAQYVSMTISGVVKNGVVIPVSPLPEGARVEIHVQDACEVPPELQEELAAWQRASADALAMTEQLAQESEGNEKR